MHTPPKWQLEVDFRETDRQIAAVVVLRLTDDTELTAHGSATRRGDDPGRAPVAEKIAAATALNDLARRLLRMAGAELGRPAD
ncbi:dsRBD fold-containing protein [Streptomyces sp. HPF1205]|uniref:dsRBD fold-containing protein n=1 Tax=Streptomyces sp. HPF1205 TaxID=2873262 RepID=UPI001CEC55E6|nr:dsRBD fold-containing protein [Streptomyces sp. HPF1205]